MWYNEHTVLYYEENTKNKNYRLGSEYRWQL